MKQYTVGNNKLFFLLITIIINGQSTFAMEHNNALSAVRTKSIKPHEYKLSNILRKTGHFLKQEASSILATTLPVVHAFPTDTIIKDINSTFYDHQYSNEPLSLDGQIAIVTVGGATICFFFCAGVFWYGYHAYHYLVHEAVPGSSSEETEDDTDDDEGILIDGD